jgi:hypothetical protein
MNRFIVADLALRSGSDKPMAEAMRPDFTVAFYCEMLGRVCRVKDCLFGRWDSPEIELYLGRWNSYAYVNCAMFLEGSNASSVAAHIRLAVPTLDIREIPIDNRADAKLLRGEQLIAEMDAGTIKSDLAEYSDACRLLDVQLRAFPAQVDGHDDFRDALSLVPVSLRMGINQSALMPPSGNFGGWPPSPCGDPIGYARWKREQGESNTDDGYVGICM